MDNIKLDVKAYPIDNPQGNTLAFASVRIDDLAAITGIRVVNGEKGLFVTMPQSQDSKGIYHDVAFPLSGDLRKAITEEVLNECERVANLAPNKRTYEKNETEMPSDRHAGDIKLNVTAFPIPAPKGDTLAFASVAINDLIAINGIRVINSDKGPFVSMPQTKDKEGVFHDIAFPLSNNLRKEISRKVLAEFKQAVAEKKQSIGAKIAEGTGKAAAYTQQQRTFAAKGAPSRVGTAGLGG